MSSSLNRAQRQAVETASGPLLVLAGAGTGKTRVVTLRIGELIRRGTRPDRILAVTFTNKAAGEMQQRVAELLGPKKKGKRRPEISTFHSLCVRILRRHITRLGYPQKFAIYDRGDQEAAARSALREIKVPGEKLRPGDLVHMIGRWKNSALLPRHALAEAESDREHLAALAYRRYQRNLKAAGAVDFDDLLLLVDQLFRRQTAVRRAEAGRFDHVLIDEYQDTNRSQYRIVRALAAGHRNLCVVGDDDQAIYGWRGAEVTHILGFQKDWPDARVVRLEQNYRSTAAILELANRLIACNLQRHVKVLRPERAGGVRPQVWQFRDEEDEARSVVDHIRGRLAEPGVEPRDIAILFRTNEQPRAFETELRRAELPYVLIGGMSFYDRKEVRDVLAYLRLLAVPHDEVSLLRVINTPPRGIGQATVRGLTAEAVSKGEPLWKILRGASGRNDLPGAALRGVTSLCGLVDEFRGRCAREPLADVVRELLQRIDYRTELTRLYPDGSELESRWASVEELVNAVAAFGKRKGSGTLQGFLEEVALTARDEGDDADSKRRRNAITLMTLHAAKGLEYPEVYLVGLEEGILPHRRSIEAGPTSIDEERRLCYVGVTRAQERLSMSLALTRQRWGRSCDTQPSRYLYEMTGVTPPAPAEKRTRSGRGRGRRRAGSR